MPPLAVYSDYSRSDVRDIVAPDAPYRPRTGSWGLQGILPIPARPNDFVFFVTIGRRDITHKFEEGISEEGVLTWQSQPAQSLADRQIQQFIQHDELTNTIYLFLRTRGKVAYTFMGRLKYLAHDETRERPVWFQWQLLAWPMPAEHVVRIGLRLQPASSSGNLDAPAATANSLIETPPPAPRAQAGALQMQPIGSFVADGSHNNARNRELGLAGELLVIGREKAALTEAGRSDLAERVRHVSILEGDCAGYDVLSFGASGKPKHIEIKTTSGRIHEPFFITSHEVAFSEAHPETYYLYRLYEFNRAANSGKFYQRQGPAGMCFDLAPQQYRARPK